MLTPRSTRRFGWVNASYVYGLTIVNTHMRRALGALTPWDAFKKATENVDTNSAGDLEYAVV